MGPKICQRAHSDPKSGPQRGPFRVLEEGRRAKARGPPSMACRWRCSCHAALLLTAKRGCERLLTIPHVPSRELIIFVQSHLPSMPSAWVQYGRGHVQELLVAHGRYGVCEVERVQRARGSSTMQVLMEWHNPAMCRTLHLEVACQRSFAPSCCLCSSLAPGSERVTVTLKLRADVRT